MKFEVNKYYFNLTLSLTYCGYQPIRNLRLLKGLKQTEAGRKLGIGQQAYSKIECSAGISETKTLKILKAFDSNKAELDLIAQFLPPPPPNRTK